MDQDRPAKAAIWPVCRCDGAFSGPYGPRLAQDKPWTGPGAPQCVPLIRRCRTAHGRVPVPQAGRPPGRRQEAERQGGRDARGCWQPVFGTTAASLVLLASGANAHPGASRRLPTADAGDREFEGAIMAVLALSSSECQRGMIGIRRSQLHGSMRSSRRDARSTCTSARAIGDALCGDRARLSLEQL